MNNKNKDYDVGFRKPPKRTQFKPGQSGNPNGRPRGAANFSTEIQRELNARVHVTEHGAKKHLTKKSVVAKRLVNKAAEGDLKATTMLLTQARLDEQAGLPGMAAPEDFANEDRQVLASILQRLRESSAIDAAQVPGTPADAPPAPEPELGEPK